MADIGLIAVALAGVIAGSVFALLPGLHVYNVVGLGVLLATHGLLSLTSEAVAMAMIGLVVGWAVVSVIPAVFLFAPDDASVFVLLPATKYMLRGAGLEAVLLIGAGSVGALACIVLLSPLFDEIFRPLRAILQPNFGWILTAICVFLILSEWPRGDDLAPTAVKRLFSAWSGLGAGILAFILSGCLGFVLLFRSPIPADAAMTNLLPAFVGLFALPSLIQSFIYGRQPPVQTTNTVALSLRQLIRGTITGVAGGMFAGFLPVISGGIGGLLAGHATAQRDERLFLISQGASKAAYYTGSLLLLFVPGLTLVRGGMAWMLSTLFVPYGWRLYGLAIAAVAFGGILAFGLLVVFARTTARLSNRMNIKVTCVLSMLLACAITLGFTGLAGCAVMGVGCLIGLIPVFIGGRRMNCLGILLLPLTLNFIGVAPDVAKWFGLL